MGETSIRAPIADYSQTTREVYIGAARYLIDAMQSMWLRVLVHRHSTKMIENLPSWVPDLTAKTDFLNLIVSPFQHSVPSFQNFIQGCRTTTTPISLHIDVCILDKIALSVTTTNETEVYDIAKPIIKTIAKLRHGIYDLFPGYHNELEGQNNCHYG